MIYYVNPLTSTALRPLVPNLYNIPTGQLGQNIAYIHSSGLGYLTLPAIKNVPSKTVTLTVVCLSSDSNVNILPSGTDNISTPSGGLITSGGSPLNISGMGSVFNFTIVQAPEGAQTGLWFAFGNNLG